LIDVIPGERVVWHVSDSYLAFVEDTKEWDDTEVVFEVSEKDGRTELRFTHVGLVPADECFDICSDAWGSYITHSLRNLITTGEGAPHRRTDNVDLEQLKHRSNRVTTGSRGR
jgi:hypothetical protein